MAYLLTGIADKAGTAQVIDELRGMNLGDSQWEFYREGRLLPPDRDALHALFRSFVQHVYLKGNEELTSVKFEAPLGRIHSGLDSLLPSSLDIRFTSSGSGAEIVRDGFDCAWFNYTPPSVRRLSLPLLQLRSRSKSYVVLVEDYRHARSARIAPFSLLTETEREKLAYDQPLIRERIKGFLREVTSPPIATAVSR